ncbi:MAG: 4-hydroxy-tetrahydrodipicolinate synthase [Calditrichaeota bacterium]|nr:4-hydroxy-tetrahydrodipicolinate synthase [Calditrichota bacterium]MBT7787490.1 4-hydroxy-tetrahydrodipicolinate synthase [Calditrichota bacterium]
MLRKKLSSSHLQGVITALVTPFDKTKVNLVKFEELVQKAVEADLCGIVPLGTTGESPALSTDERHALIQRAIDAADGKLAVIVGTGTNNTKTTIENSRVAAQLGADAVLIVTPYYNKPTPAGLKRHFTNVANSSPLPVILYHIPGRCGVGIPASLVLELGKHENIIGVKEAGGDVWRSGEIAANAPGNFAVLSGDDTLTLPLMSVGATGTISVISNIAPKLTKSMVDFALGGDFINAMNIHRKLSPLLGSLSLETNPGPIKEAMNLIGLEVGQVRPPLANVVNSTKKAISKALENLGDLQ